jgi:hypothetical protein
MAKPTVKLNDKSRELVKDAIEAEREIGSRKLAVALEMLLKCHDQAHGITEDR